VTVLCALPSARYVVPDRRDPDRSDTVDRLSGSLSRAVLRSVMSYRNGQEIYGENDASEHWYCLISGAARKYALMADGRRRIVDFLLPGDFFGFRARHQHSFAADAIAEGTTVARYLRRSLETAADSDPRLGREIREIAFQSISRSQARLLILGRVTALEKVGAFLVEMADRCLDRSDQTVFLPMSRYDIADYLAISVETVSRALTELNRCGTIRFIDKRHVYLVDCASLDNGFERSAKMALQ
jgi:CRP/FNR family transcriptional regulator, nitrogen fixation regulation protein